MSKIIYLDDNFGCHVADDGTMTAVETDIFDGKCSAFIEGFRHVPEGQSWIRGDGKKFSGEMTVPRTSFASLAAAQAQYESDQAEMQDMRTALDIMLTGGTSE